MLNQVTLVGRLTRDPEVRRTADGKAVTNVTVAVSRHFRNQNGEIEADFVPCTLWRKAAENTAQYCRKGSMVGVIGKIQTRFYENQEGKRVYVTEVIAESIQFIDSRPAKNSTSASPQTSTTETAATASQETIPAPVKEDSETLEEKILK